MRRTTGLNLNPQHKARRLNWIEKDNLIVIMDTPESGAGDPSLAFSLAPVECVEFVRICEHVTRVGGRRSAPW